MEKYEEEKQNISLGLLKLVQKSKTKELSWFEKWKLNNKLSNYLTQVIPVTTYESLESLGINELKDRLSEMYHEARQIPDELMKKTLDKMKNVYTSDGGYYIGEKLKASHEKIEDLVNQEF